MFQIISSLWRFYQQQALNGQELNNNNNRKHRRRRDEEAGEEEEEGRRMQSSEDGVVSIDEAQQQQQQPQEQYVNGHHSGGGDGNQQAIPSIPSLAMLSPSSPSSSSMTSVLDEELRGVLQAWQGFDLGSRTRKLEEQTALIAKSQSEAMTRRKKLAEQTRAFRQISLEDQPKSVGGLIKAYQVRFFQCFKNSSQRWQENFKLTQWYPRHCVDV